ncbi:amidohydrolase family protein [Streptomyces noursei]|nr:amidohydrolase family protein [Streptomyces noursei]
MRAAVFHRTRAHGISARAAFTAHTRGGWRAIGRDDAGVLMPGAPADYAVWRTGDLIVQAPTSASSAGRPTPAPAPLACPISPPATTSRTACARSSADGRSSTGRSSDIAGAGGGGYRARTCLPHLGRLGTDLGRRENHAGGATVDSRRRSAGRFGRVHHRTSDRETSAQSSNAAGPWGGEPSGTPPLGARSRARAMAGSVGRCDPDGARRSVDNGSRSTRSQRVPGRPEGRRAPIRTPTPRTMRHRAPRSSR